MSYADAELDLSSVGVACLAGANGAGKSAILDAITWALWERARAQSDELVRLGQQEMWVAVSFVLEGVTYRVRRARKKIRSGSKTVSRGSVELQVHSCGSWRSLTAGSQRETRSQIVNLLHLDYDTFINSAYLRQGKADEFTTRAPSERKQILSEILGLSLFDQLQELAREQVRKLKGRFELLELSIRALPDLEQRINLMEGGLSQLTESAQQVAAQVCLSQDSHARLQDRLRDLNLMEQRLNAGLLRKRELEADIAALAGRQGSLLEQQKQALNLTSRSVDIEQKAYELAQLKKQVEELDDKALLLQELTEQRLEFAAKLAGMRSRLEVSLDHLRLLLSEKVSKCQQLAKDEIFLHKVDTAYNQYKELVAKESELAARQEAYVQLNARADDLASLVQENRIRLEAELEHKVSLCAELEQLQNSCSVLNEEKVAIENQVNLLDKLEVEFELVEQKGLKAKSELASIDIQVKELRRRQQEKRAKIAELEECRSSSICPLCSAPIVDRSAVIKRYLNEIEQNESEISSLAGQVYELEAVRQVLRAQYTEMRRKLDCRKVLDKQIGQFNEKMAAVERAGAAACDLTLEIARSKTRLQSKDYAAVERESLINVKAELHKLNFDPAVYASIQAQIRKQRYAEARYQQAQRDEVELKKAAQEIPILQAQADDISRQLDSDDYGQEWRTRLDEVVRLADNLYYDRTWHQDLKQRLPEIMPASEAKHDLQRAAAELPGIERQLAECEAAHSAKCEQASQLAADITFWQDSLFALPELGSELKVSQEATLRLLANREELATRLAVDASRLDQLQDERNKLFDKIRDCDQTRSHLDDFQLLAEALGKKGIQAVIIDSAIPEIESEANRILSRLTDNQMHVALVTQHLTRSGSIVETLELLIGDEVGTRNYELYSGGEAFKVDFSLRVALARLLARRAGAKLETLIIDEGFGSQDEESRLRLVRVIAAIQNDFARILLITHIDEIKEMFPTHIYVHKENGISKIQIGS